METTIEIQNLTKVFKRGRGLLGLFRKKGEVKEKTVRAVDDVSLQIKSGELFGLLGPNGAGKTTLIKCLASLLIADQGSIRINGFDILRNPVESRYQMGLMTSGERTMYWKLSARDNLRYFAALYGLEPKAIEQRIDYLIKLVDLTERQDDRVEKYSSGMKQKVSLARVLLHNPPILFLDEPTLGLDPTFAKYIRGIIKEKLNQEMGKTILLTTHYMDEADKLCDRIAIMNKGRIVALGSPKELKQSIPFETVLEMNLTGEIDLTPLNSISGVEKVYQEKKNEITRLKIYGKDLPVVLNQAVQVVLSQNARLGYINLTEPNLEDVFIYMTGERLSDETERDENSSRPVH